MSLDEQIAVRDADGGEQPARGFRSRAHRNPVHLLECHLEWRNRGRLDAYQELVAALDDCDEEARTVAETLLHRPSPRRQLRRKSVRAKFGGGRTR